MAENFQKQLDGLISCQNDNPERKKLLLHACCAPCASYVLEYLTEYFDIAVYYFNPNIYPQEEYKKRLLALDRLLSVLPLSRPVRLIEGPYDAGEFDKAAQGMETQREGGRRCAACFELRLRETAREAKAGGFDYFCTTLTISPHKNAQIINSIGTQISTEYEIQFLPSDFKKKNGYKRSIELCGQYELYRQNYCGCAYSINNAFQYKECEEH